MLSGWGEPDVLDSISCCDYDPEVCMHVLCVDVAWHGSLFLVFFCFFVPTYAHSSLSPAFSVQAERYAIARRWSVSVVITGMSPQSLHPTPYTLHPTPYILHPTPYTLHPTPYILHPSPYTLLPTPYTLHPTRYALHPTPYTPHPTPCILHPAPGTMHLAPCTLHPAPYIR